MASAPYGVRLLVGAAVTAIEETRRLPQTILTYPMTLASQVAQVVMKVQQDVADLVIKGDATLETLFPARDEQPPWAIFDEDGDDDSGAAPAGADNGQRLTEGRFALYSIVEDDIEAPVAEKKPRKPAKATAAKRQATTPPPAIVGELDYEALTLAQLRARLPTLSVGELESLLAYEEAAKARAPFQTLLANRISRATAK